MDFPIAKRYQYLRKFTPLKVSLVLAIFCTHIYAQSKSAPQTLDVILENAASAQKIDEIYTSQINQEKMLSSIKSRWDNPDINLDTGRLKNSGNTGISYSLGFEQRADIFGLKRLGKKYSESKLAVLNFEKRASLSQLFNLHLLRWMMLKLESDRLAFLKKNKHELEVMAKYLKNKKFRSNEGKATAFLIRNKVTGLQIEYRARAAYIENQFHYFKQFNPTADLETILGQSSWPAISQINELFAQTIANRKLFDEADELLHEELERQEEQHSAQGKGSFAFRYDYFKEKVPGGNTGHNVGLTYNIPLYSDSRDYSQVAKFQKKYEFLMHKKERFLAEQRIIQLENEFSSLYKQFTKLESQTQLKKDFNELKDLFFKGAIAISSFLDSFDMLHERTNQRFEIRHQLLEKLIEVANIRGIKMESKGVLK